MLTSSRGGTSSRRDRTPVIKLRKALSAALPRRHRSGRPSPRSIDEDLAHKSLPPVGFANPALYLFAQAPSELPAPASTTSRSGRTCTTPRDRGGTWRPVSALPTSERSPTISSGTRELTEQARDGHACKRPDNSTAGAMIVTCRHCGARVPAGVFCGNCGEHLEGVPRVDGPRPTPCRTERAREPSAVITTLFPHLPHRQTHVFREMLVIGVGVVLLLAALPTRRPATLVSVLLLPCSICSISIESEVYEDEPVQVAAPDHRGRRGARVRACVIANHLTTAQLSGTVQGPLVTGVLLPVIAQVLMLAGPVVLVTRRKFDETLDELTFAVASALGFTLVAVVAGSWPFFTAPLVHGIAADDVLRILRSGVVASVVNAGTTGVVAAALWRRAPGHAGRAGWVTPVGVIAGFAVQIVLGVTGYYTPDPLSLLLIWTALGAVLLVVVEVVLHAALLEEAGTHTIRPLAPCGECLPAGPDDGVLSELRSRAPCRAETRASRRGCGRVMTTTFGGHFCGRCGAPLAGSAFCGRCGAPTGLGAVARALPLPPYANTTHPSKLSHTTIIVAAIAAIALLATLVTVFAVKVSTNAQACGFYCGPDIGPRVPTHASSSTPNGASSSTTAARSSRSISQTRPRTPPTSSPRTRTAAQSARSSSPRWRRRTHRRRFRAP